MLDLFQCKAMLKLIAKDMKDLETRRQLKRIKSKIAKQKTALLFLENIATNLFLQCTLVPKKEYVCCNSVKNYMLHICALTKCIPYNCVPLAEKFASEFNVQVAKNNKRQEKLQDCGLQVGVRSHTQEMLIRRVSERAFNVPG